MKSLKTGGRRPATIRSVLLWGCVCGLVLSTGCRKRDTVEPTVGIDSPEDTWVRVLLFGNLRECSLATPAGFTAEGLGNGVLADFSDTEPMTIGIVNGRIRVGEHVLCRAILLRPKDPYYFDIDGQGFRGNLILEVTDDDRHFQAVNAAPLESYLLGVVGAEMNSFWEPEALKAQAVAARTYCLAIKHRFGGGRSWDVRRTQSHQVYGGIAAENVRIRRAVLETTGQILIGAGRDGNEMLFPTYYSSSCGGHTEPSQNVFGSDAVMTDGVECPWCEPIARRRDYYWGPVTYTMSHVSERLLGRYPSLERLERITDVEVMRTGALERITYVRLIGATGHTDSLRGEDFRLALDPTGRRLKSALVDMKKEKGRLVFENGRGFGHGVGLCQCGAQGLARQGWSYSDILAFYFPDTRLVTIETAEAP